MVTKYTHTEYINPILSEYIVVNVYNVVNAVSEYINHTRVVYHIISAILEYISEYISLSTHKQISGYIVISMHKQLINRKLRSVALRVLAKLDGK